MVQTKIADIQDEQIQSLLSEIEQVTSRPVSAHQGLQLFHYLDMAVRDDYTRKFKGLNASGFYKGSMLRTKVEAFDNTSVGILVESLCTHFKVNSEFTRPKQLYIAISDVYNPKSKLRKPPPIRFW